MAAWQFWQRSTVSPPQELRSFGTQYCSRPGCVARKEVADASRFLRSLAGFCS